uniref:Uncharacterized protein n=1 Tax=Caulerpa verticillata TaxID=177082 RepID=A0A386B0D4_9CHLO|nr:hypothetical protein [Caulerpa verticillata]AYC65155.1 hypothetical protein [Caulerpa verticillata]
MRNYYISYISNTCQKSFFLVNIYLGGACVPGGFARSERSELEASSKRARSELEASSKRARSELEASSKRARSELASSASLRASRGKPTLHPMLMLWFLF